MITVILAACFIGASSTHLPANTYLSVPPDLVHTVLPLPHYDPNLLISNSLIHPAVGVPEHVGFVPANIYDAQGIHFSPSVPTNYAPEINNSSVEFQPPTQTNYTIETRYDGASSQGLQSPQFYQSAAPTQYDAQISSQVFPPQQAPASPLTPEISQSFYNTPRPTIDASISSTPSSNYENYQEPSREQPTAQFSSSRSGRPVFPSASYAAQNAYSRQLDNDAVAVDSARSDNAYDNGVQNQFSGLSSDDGRRFSNQESGLNEDQDNGNNAINYYRFTYDVNSIQNGLPVMFSHEEQRNGDLTDGKYSVLLPDGNRQLVEYTADQDGFKPVITYSNVGLASHEVYNRRRNLVEPAAPEASSAYRPSGHPSNFQRIEPASLHTGSQPGSY